MRIVPHHDPFYRDRREAGPDLADLLEALEVARQADLVVGLARGGVVAAAAVAGRLGVPLGVACAHKVAHPSDHRYVVGSMAMTGHGCVFRPDGVDLDALEGRARSALAKAQALYANLDGPSWPSPEGKDVVVVDDGMTSGATMLAGVRAVKGQGARRVFAATPVSSEAARALVAMEAESVHCVHVLEQFGVVGMCYEDFSSVSEEEVLRLLHESNREAASRR